MFTQFMELPPELRLLIWELAVRPLLPSIHYFMIDREDDDGGGKYFTTLPTDRHPDRYLLGEMDKILLMGEDSGLWTACKESRCVVQRAFKSRFPRTEGSAPVIFGTRRYRRLADSSKTRSRADEYARTYLSTDAWIADASFGVLPQKDLTVSQAVSRNTWDVNKVIRDLGSTKLGLGVAFDEPIAFEYFAFWSFNYDMSLGLRAGPEGRDYTAGMLTRMMQAPGPRALFLSLLMARYDGRIKSKTYLIQYGTSQKPNFDHRRENRTTFSGCGFTLTQASSDEIGSLTYSPREMGRVHSGCKLMTAWEFEETIWFMFFRLFGFRDSGNHVRIPHHAEVLVCEVSKH
ncbi:hypothetical protein CGCF415_v006636 [Colletotrichum fructicola]|uniref:2EXR domain-containing protein n=1 Tax=Colletotrichum fructicola (strain Nara gc5) TaxID=1213859 RepID=L2GEN5_COLFN|nr:uncharacterized protein CGMCC3_g12175 [Colletotrichum fructicola]KAE9571639.1 hypothetical protein CGMCC3_g12175 [Colletotrichum fructicola]KAF4886021.1 hypothetical protein CGCFRS4_v011498 [Colletotrichum fructicola]KAF4908300.1 hypothetical protein CGCF415_v006636 [Colletotrichum fructicola]KAF4928113.1 hypothetical protein CGCF245_v012811 [Colletotrichum fructicola]